MSDAIAKAIGLSEEDTTSLLQKYYAFIASLNPAQQAVMKGAVSSLEAAASIIGGGITADELNAYISKRLAALPTSAVAIPVASAVGIPVVVGKNVEAPSVSGIPVAADKNVE
jgi:hypothetical protein